MLSSVLTRIRERFGLTAEELAARAGIAPGELQGVEAGTVVLDATGERALVEALLVVIGPRAQAAVELDDPGLIARQRAMSMGTRLESGFALSRFASELAGTARR